MNYHKYRKPKDSGIMIGLLLGAVAGATLGILLTSDKGKEVIGGLKEDIKDAAGKAEKDIRKAYGRFEDKLVRSKEMARGLEKKAKKYVQEKTR